MGNCATIFLTNNTYRATNIKNPNKIEQDLMKLLPKEEWFDFTNRMIDYGREHCKANCKHLACPLKSYIQK